MILSEEEIAFFRTIPAASGIAVSYALSFGLVFATVGLIYYDKMLWAYYNSSGSFRLAMLVFWLGLVAIGIFIPIVWGKEKNFQNEN